MTNAVKHTPEFYFSPPFLVNLGGLVEETMPKKKILVVCFQEECIGQIIIICASSFAITFSFLMVFS